MLPLHYRSRPFPSSNDGGTCVVSAQVYRNHFQMLLAHQFPDHYSKALWLVVTGISSAVCMYYCNYTYTGKWLTDVSFYLATDSSAIIPESWKDMSRSLVSSEDPGKYRLGLQQVCLECRVFIRTSTRLACWVHSGNKLLNDI